MWPICASCRFFVLVVSGESPACCCLNGSPLISMKTRVHKVGKQGGFSALVQGHVVSFPSLPGS